MPKQSITWRLIDVKKNPLDKLPDYDPDAFYALMVSREGENYIALLSIRYQAVLQLMDCFEVTDPQALNGKTFVTANKYSFPASALEFLLKKNQHGESNSAANFSNPLSRALRSVAAMIRHLAGLFRR
jgi:hypothetical protein